MEIIREHAYARAGLIGNPSDGYHGKTISHVVRDFCAQVVLYDWEDLEIIPSQQDHSQFGSLTELVQDVELHGYYGGMRLVKATIKRFSEYCEGRHELADKNFSIRYESNIPRLVGLAGSSAIIVATLRSLIRFFQVEIPQQVQPSLALSVETKELGIAAGLQDRVIQVYEGLVAMDFSEKATKIVDGMECGEYESMDASLLPPVYVAYRSSSSEPTERTHSDLKSRFEQGDKDVVAAMESFAELSAAAKQAILAGDHDELSRLIDLNFDTRQRICQLAPDHVEMIMGAREAGASAKFAGSGGAIVGTYRDQAMLARLRESLNPLGCRVILPQLA